MRISSAIFCLGLVGFGVSEGHEAESTEAAVRDFLVASGLDRCEYQPKHRVINLEISSDNNAQELAIEWSEKLCGELKGHRLVVAKSKTGKFAVIGSIFVSER